MGARLLTLYGIGIACQFQSTRPAWGRDAEESETSLPHGISIHAPRMGARRLKARIDKYRKAFQSTRPAWGRDSLAIIRYVSTPHFNPRAPHGGATEWKMMTRLPFYISIHAPRMGARLVPYRVTARNIAFQSTRPAWGRDVTRRMALDSLAISIHAPRMGARPLRGEVQMRLNEFQSTRPAWGRDAATSSASSSSTNFNPRAPHGGATTIIALSAVYQLFQSTRPAWGRDAEVRTARRRSLDFNPRAPHGGATRRRRSLRHGGGISIHAPRMGARQCLFTRA